MLLNVYHTPISKRNRNLGFIYLVFALFNFLQLVVDSQYLGFDSLYLRSSTTE